MRISRIVAPVAAACALASCDVSTTNPGAITDDYLDSPAAHQGLVNGMSRSLSRALNYVALTGSGQAREVVASGGTVFGFTIKQRTIGLLDPAPEETNDHWQFAQQARWVSEDGVRRLRSSLGNGFASSSLAAQALNHVGYANRLLGENMCQAVIDGGPAEPRSVYFSRAQAAFTEALTIASAANDAASTNAARAGRAGVRAWLGDWAGAAADGTLVPATFVYQIRYSAVELDQYNRIFWASGNEPFRGHTVAGTFFESYYASTGDPRVPWKRNASVPLAPLGNPWFIQAKFDKRDAPMNLASGAEMRLILAEALLRSGDWQSALARINERRIQLGLPGWTATNSTEAWSALKRERSIELWLEGRRLGDLFRWIEAKTPGDMEDMTGRSLCFPIGQTELTSNPNV
ncbi:MAG TPA: RagB/SusD family nutrient uptake outer membrane protein [Gemmatimonadaceae bacterium]|nr:RagB/SusD family nutrient uptake outer membrane protein [Gemmatimonadaceae bacterium]